MKTKEEILAKQYEMAVYDNNGHLTKGDILSSMQEYADQFAQPEQSINAEIKDIIDCILKFDSEVSAGQKAIYFDTIQRDLRKAEQPREQITDEDISNAASDYVGYKEDKDTLEIRYLSREQYAIKAYKQGATDMRDKKIYISPKSDTTHPLIPSPQEQVREAIEYNQKIIEAVKESIEPKPDTSQVEPHSHSFRAGVCCACGHVMGEPKREQGAEEYFNQKAKEDGYDDEDQKEHFSYWLDCSIVEKQKDKLIKWMDEYANSRAKEITDEGKCDVCGNHPSVLIRTQFGRYCQLHAKYV